MLNRRFLSFGILLLSSLAASHHSEKPGCCNRGFKDGQIEMGIAESAKIKPVTLFDWNFGLGANFLLWNVSQQNMDIYFDADGVITEQKYIYLPGVRVVLYGDYMHDDWQASLTWTRILSRTKTRSPEGSSYGITAPWVAQGEISGQDSSLLSSVGNLTASDIISTWTMHFNNLTCMMMRPIYVSSKLTMSSAVGAEFAWLRQRLQLSRKIGDETASRVDGLRSNSWAAGPMLSTKSVWMLPCDIGIESFVAGSVIYQTTRIRNIHVYNVNNGHSSYVALRTRPRGLKPHLQGGLSLIYGSYVNDKAWDFHFKVGYEFNIYWLQNEMRKESAQNALLMDIPNRALSSPIASELQVTDRMPVTDCAGNLAFHGLVVELVFDF